MNNRPDTYRLGDICRVINGRAYSQDELLANGKYRVLRVGNFFSNNSWYYSDMELDASKYCYYGDLLYAWSASFGPKIWDGDKAIYHYHIWKMEPNEKYIIKKYLFYFLQKHTQVILGATHGSIMLHITKKFIEDVSLKVPSIVQQQQIAAVLSALDDKIELNRKINSELDQMARTLYDYWFVQFDFPNASGKPYKSSGGAMKFSPELNREIPEGWQVNRLNEQVKIGSGFPFKSSTYIEDGKYKIITIKNVKSGELDSDNADTVQELPRGLPKNCYLEVGDLLVSLTGNVGRMAFVTENNLLLNQRVGKFEITNKLSLEYIYLLMTRPEEEQRILSLASGSSQANLSPIQAIDFSIVVPDSDSLSKFQKTIEPMFAKIIANRQQSQKLAHLRDWLLPMLMNGQMKVI